MNELKRAQALELPSREQTLNREHSVQRFWHTNKDILSKAWKQWEHSERSNLVNPTLSILDLKLKEAVETAWRDPEQEHLLKELIHEVSPGVYRFQMFDVEELIKLRAYLKMVENSGIPLRAPYGIVLNRKGYMLDPRSEGYLAAPSFQSFYRSLIDLYMRPIARLLYPEITGYDTQSFGFSITYQPEKDTSIRMHTDASSVTLNVNLNLANEQFTGSELDFHDQFSGELNRVSFGPGSAVIHRGNTPHKALPIKSGERTNFVLWLYGNHMRIPRINSLKKEIDPKLRWSLSEAALDEYAPF